MTTNWDGLRVRRFIAYYNLKYKDVSRQLFITEGHLKHIMTRNNDMSKFSSILDSILEATVKSNVAYVEKHAETMKEYYTNFK